MGGNRLVVIVAVGLIGACSGGGPYARDAGGDDAAVIDAAVEDAADDATVEDASDDATVEDAADDAARDAAVDDAAPIDARPTDARPIDARPIDARPIDAQPIDAQPIDAQPIDAQPIDAAVPEVGQFAVSMRNAGGLWQRIGGTDAELERMDGPGQVAVVINSSRAWGTTTVRVYERDSSGPSVPRWDDWLSLRADGPGRLLAFTSDSYFSKLAVTVDTVAGAAQVLWHSDLLGPVPPHWRDVIRHGDGLLLGGGSSVWEVDAAGVEVGRRDYSDFQVAVFPRGQPGQALGLDSAGAVVSLDLMSGTRTVVPSPPGLTGVTFVAPSTGEQIWIRGELDGAPAVAPLGATVATPLGRGTFHMAVDAAGRLVVAESRGGRRTLWTRRYDAARFDGVDGASRLDPTYGGDGLAELVLCTSACDVSHATVENIAVASDGSVVVVTEIVWSSYDVNGDYLTSGGWSELWWFDPP